MMFHDSVTACQPSQIVLAERMELPRDRPGVDEGFSLRWPMSQ
jgi:hypothetical protein